MEVARHLIAAGRAEEALDACLRAADEAERASGFDEANGLIERVLPHVSDPHDRALLLYRMGRLRWLDGEPAAGEQLLVDAVRRLDELGLATEAAEARVHLSRCYWELERPDEAMQAVELAREALEREGPSAELALAYIRIAGFHAFRLDYDLCREAAERGAEIAEQASADFERVWALSFVALGHFGTAHEFVLFDQIYREAIEKGYSIIAGNTVHNEIWDRVHTLAGGTRAAAERYEQVPFLARTLGVEISESWAELAQGEPRTALEQAQRSVERHENLGNPKFAWRAHLAVAEALLELGRSSEAAEALPPPSPGSDLQDIVYDTPARVGVAIALERRRGSGRARPACVKRRRAAPHPWDGGARGGGIAGGREAGRGGSRGPPSQSARRSTWGSRGSISPTGGFSLQPDGQQKRGRSSSVPSRPSRDPASGSGPGAPGHSRVRRPLSPAMRTRRVRCSRRASATPTARARFGLETPLSRQPNVSVSTCRRLEDEPDSDLATPGVLTAGERMVTSMFADVRGYTPIAAASAPEDLADRMTTLHRWAAAEVGKRQGIVDKFAGDAVMATFNVTGARVDHAALALDAALALRDKAALMDLPVGIGIAVGPAVVSRSVDERNVSVLGSTTNLAARLQTAAGGGDILLSDEAFRRVSSWLAERGLTAEPEQLELKGFDGAQPAYRLASPVRA